MKKTYLDLSRTRVIRHAPCISSGRFKALGAAGGRAYKTEGGSPEGAEDNRKEEELLTKIQERIDKALEGRATKEELEQIRNSQREELAGLSLEALRSMADDRTGAMATLAKQGLEITRLKASIETRQIEDMSIRGQVKSWMEKNKEILDAVRSGRSREIPALNLQLRAVDSPMTPVTVNPGASPYIGRIVGEPGINDFLRAKPTFWDYLTKGRTNATTYYWVNKTNPQGAAAFLAPGQPKPGVSFQLAVEASNPKKVADSAKAAKELLDDIDGMTTFIEQELRYQVMIKVNSETMTGAGSSTAPKGIQTYSTTYTLTSIKTTNANDFDALRAVVAQMRSGYLTGDITIFINPIDSANMDLTKANTAGTYLLPPFSTADGKNVSGARVVEDSAVPVGFFQAAYLQFYRILMYEDFNITWGWENDDFTKNLVTAIGEMRFHQFVNSIYSDSGAFVYDSFANVKTLLNTP